MTVDESVVSDRRDALKKLAVGGALAWTAPAIAKPAFAQGTPSGCTPATLDWSTVSSPFTSAVVSGVTVSLVTSMYGGSAAQSDNRTIVSGEHGLIPGSFIQFNQDAVTNGGQNITFNFSAPVQNLSFTVTDIDNSSGAWSDRITVVTSGFSYTIPTGSTVIGVGATGNGTGGTTTDGNGGSNTGTGAFRNSLNNTNLPNSGDNRGNLVLGAAGPITSFAWQFWCGGYDSSNQRIFVSNLTFDVCP